jgi:hypothetical protein
MTMDRRVDARTIKFRALVPDEEDESGNEVFHMTDELAFEDYAPINDLLAQCDYNIMQYTGMKDKFDQQIFEDDIVIINTMLTTKICKIEFVAPGFVLNFNGHLIREWKGKDCTVIGNIHLHPHLL